MTEIEKVNRLRTLMRDLSIDCCYVITSDPHNSEYVAPRYQTRAWLSGFTGSAGTAIVTQDEALVWADGRYYIQAAKEIENTPFSLMKLGKSGVLGPEDWMLESLPEGSRISVDGSVFSESRTKNLEKRLEKKGMSLVTDLDLVGDIWDDRPGLPKGALFLHPIEYTGRTAMTKIDDVREQLVKDGADYALYVGLDDVAWLMNFRGKDIPSSMLSLAFALITCDEAFLFIGLDKVTDEIGAYFKGQKITLRPYDTVAQALSELPEGAIELNPKRVSRSLFQALPAHVRVIEKEDIPYLAKAELNDTELRHQFAAGVRESVVITRFLYFVRKKAVALGMDEYDVAEKLHSLRAETEGFINESFATISAYGPNAAMMHYQATKTKRSPLQAKSFYLVDCGAQSLGGTTDVTRTVALGPLTEEEKRDFTLTLKSHIALASLPFLKYTCGIALDAVARSVMWRHNLDYKCGTGHGFGYLTGVHEGPQGLSNSPSSLYRFREHNVITIEPGVYREGKHGIRLENDYVVLKANQSIETRDGIPELIEEHENINEAGDQFLRFQPLTYIPFDRASILPEMLTCEEKIWLNDYNLAIRREVAPFLEGDELEDLMKETEPF